jgi:hypothetical protein
LTQEDGTKCSFLVGFHTSFIKGLKIILKPEEIDRFDSEPLKSFFKDGFELEINFIDA